MMHAAHRTVVCSNRPRPSVQKGAKGNQHWRRDVFHLAESGRTLCGRDASEYLTIQIKTDAAMTSTDLCTRCVHVAQRG